MIYGGLEGPDAAFSTDSRSIDLLVSETKSILFYGRTGMLPAQGEHKENGSTEPGLKEFLT